MYDNMIDCMCKALLNENDKVAVFNEFKFTVLHLELSFQKVV